MNETLRGRGLYLVRRSEERSPYPKASLWLRAGARVVDTAIAWALFQSTGPAGIVIALLYTLFADGMLQGQSPGKKIFGVRAVYLPTRQGARHRDSVLRNAPFGLVIILFMMPELGFKAFIVGGLLIGTIEGLRVYKDALGVRLGDLWAQTQVTDGKIALGRDELAQLRGEGRVTARMTPRDGAPQDGA
jgi:uncharacterized RDD family membrane protein YckC